MSAHAKVRPCPPREVWPLLSTIALTLAAMAGIILWFAAPAVAVAVITGCVLGVAGVALLGLTFWAIARMVLPRSSQRTHPRMM